VENPEKKITSSYIALCLLVGACSQKELHNCGLAGHRGQNERCVAILHIYREREGHHANIKAQNESKDTIQKKKKKNG